MAIRNNAENLHLILLRKERPHRVSYPWKPWTRQHVMAKPRGMSSGWSLCKSEVGPDSVKASHLCCSFQSQVKLDSGTGSTCCSSWSLSPCHAGRLAKQALIRLVTGPSTIVSRSQKTGSRPASQLSNRPTPIKGSQTHRSSSLQAGLVHAPTNNDTTRPACLFICLLNVLETN